MSKKFASFGQLLCFVSAMTQALPDQSKASAQNTDFLYEMAVVSKINGSVSNYVFDDFSALNDHYISVVLSDDLGVEEFSLAFVPNKVVRNSMFDERGMLAGLHYVVVESSNEGRGELPLRFNSLSLAVEWAINAQDEADCNGNPRECSYEVFPAGESLFGTIPASSLKAA